MDNIQHYSRFINIDGVSCYMISILHILQQIPSFVDVIINNNIKINKNTVIYELRRAIKTSISNNNITITLKSFKKIIGNINFIWINLQHQDSQEFFNFLISKIDEELKQQITYIPIIKNNNININISHKTTILQIIALNYIQRIEQNNYSPITNLFVGYFISNIKCSLCSTISPSFESFISLSLSIPFEKNDINKEYTLEECFSNFIANETLDKFNKLTCDLCGIKNQPIKNIKIWKAPKILVIHLKRFITNKYGINSKKRSNNIIYPINNFNIYNYYHYHSPYKNNTLYTLIGINIHISFGHNSINVGHYISLVKNIYNNKWLLFDDANPIIEITNESIIQNKNAYLLFYLKNEL